MGNCTLFIKNISNFFGKILMQIIYVHVPILCIISISRDHYQCIVIKKPMIENGIPGELSQMFTTNKRMTVNRVRLRLTIKEASWLIWVLSIRLILSLLTLWNSHYQSASMLNFIPEGSAGYSFQMWMYLLSIARELEE